eukprot:3047273-Pyramimonas_sp.AAC.1
MPILGTPFFSEGDPLRLASPLGVSILGIGMRSRLASPSPSSTNALPPEGAFSASSAPGGS